MMKDEGLGSLIARIAVTDQQTGVYTYKHFVEQMEKEIARSKRYSNNMTVLTIQLDITLSFEEDEDIQAGDRILRDFAELVADTTRNVDMVARRGVTTFYVCLLETGQQDAEGFVKRLQERMAKEAFGDLPPGQLTASVGLASCPVQSDDLHELLSFSEQAMEQAVSGNKGGFMTYDPDMDPEKPIQ